MTTKRKINKKNLFLLLFSGVCGVISVFFLIHAIYTFFYGKIDMLVVDISFSSVFFIISANLFCYVLEV